MAGGDKARPGERTGGRGLCRQEDSRGEVQIAQGAGQARRRAAGQATASHVIEAARAARMGTKHTAETRRKMSETHRRLWKRRPGVWTKAEDADRRPYLIRAGGISGVIARLDELPSLVPK
jgi:hypothetical protein